MYSTTWRNGTLRKIRNKLFETVYTLHSKFFVDGDNDDEDDEDWDWQQLLKKSVLWNFQVSNFKRRPYLIVDKKGVAFNGIGLAM